MKKLPFALLFVLVIVYLCACGAAGPVVRAAITNPPAIAQSVSVQYPSYGGDITNVSAPLSILND